MAAAAEVNENKDPDEVPKGEPNVDGVLPEAAVDTPDVNPVAEAVEPTPELKMDVDCRKPKLNELVEAVMLAGANEKPAPEPKEPVLAEDDIEELNPEPDPELNLELEDEEPNGELGVPKEVPLNPNVGVEDDPN